MVWQSTSPAPHTTRSYESSSARPAATNRGSDFITEWCGRVRRSVTERERQQPFFRDEVAVECGGAATALNHVLESGSWRCRSPKRFARKKP